MYGGLHQHTRVVNRRTNLDLRPSMSDSMAQSLRVMVQGLARPHIVSRFGTENGEPVRPSGRLDSAKLVIHVKYGIFIYFYLTNQKRCLNKLKEIPSVHIYQI